MLSITFTAVTVGALIAFKTHLPKLVDDGHLTATFSHVVAPSAAALNAACCIALVRRGRNLTTLQLWLLVAVVAEMLDSFLNAYAPYRFSYGWYIGKLETVLTSSVVLAVLVSEVTTISRCLTQLAVVDSLTSLHNRRAFDEQLETMLRYARRVNSGLGLTFSTSISSRVTTTRMVTPPATNACGASPPFSERSRADPSITFRVTAAKNSSSSFRIRPALERSSSLNGSS